MELEEFKEREKDQKEMYETMMTALKGDGRAADENQMKQLKEMHDKNVKELRDEYESQFAKLRESKDEMMAQMERLKNE